MFGSAFFREIQEKVIFNRILNNTIVELNTTFQARKLDIHMKLSHEYGPTICIYHKYLTLSTFLDNADEGLLTRDHTENFNKNVYRSDVM